MHLNLHNMSQQFLWSPQFWPEKIITVRVFSETAFSRRSPTPIRKGVPWGPLARRGFTTNPRLDWVPSPLSFSQKAKKASRVAAVCYFHMFPRPFCAYVSWNIYFALSMFLQLAGCRFIGVSLCDLQDNHSKMLFYRHICHKSLPKNTCF